MAAYSTVQTGPKTQPGGVQEGLARLAYQAPGSNRLPKKAAPYETARNRTRGRIRYRTGHAPSCGFGGGSPGL